MPEALASSTAPALDNGTVEAAAKDGAATAAATSTSLEHLIERLTASLAQREEALKEQEFEKQQPAAQARQAAGPCASLAHAEDVAVGDIVAINGRRGEVSWNGRPDYNFIKVRWQDGGAESGVVPFSEVMFVAAGASVREGAVQAVVAPLMVESPERPRHSRRPPFAWQPSPDFGDEFQVSGAYSEIVTKVGDFKEKDWVIPAGGTLQLTRGGAYRWTLCIEQTSRTRPQMQLGVHGAGHRRPWRLLSTARCSRARDDEAWIDRPGGDRALGDGDLVHFEVDLRGLHLPFGTFSVAVNGEPPEIVFDDLPLSSTRSTPLIPVVSMGGDQSRVRLCPAY